MNTFLCALVAFAAVGCGKLGGTPTFNLPSTGGGSSVLAAFAASGWSGPVTIDVGTQPVSIGGIHPSFNEANNDVSSSCTAMWGGSLETPVTEMRRGCMQSPAVAYTDNRFLVGFTQNYIGQADSEPRVTLFDAMTLPLTHTFVGGLNPIDSGRGLFPWSQQAPFPGPGGALPIQTSSRYVKYATFPDGNIIAVYYVELPITPGWGNPLLNFGNSPFGSGTFPVSVSANYSYTRVIFASIYSATLHRWQPAVQIGTATVPTAPSTTYTGVNQTDMGIDFGEQVALGPLYGQNPYILGSYANFCRPSVATAGDNSAMVVWCEQPQTTVSGALYTAPEPLSQIMYARYVEGNWVKVGSGFGQPLITSPPNTSSASQPLIANPYFAGRDNHLAGTAGFAAGSSPINHTDFFVSGFTFGQKQVAAPNYTIVVGAQAMAVTANPIGNQFLITYNSQGGILGCTTLSAMISVLLAQPVSEYWQTPANGLIAASGSNAFFGKTGHPPLPSATLSQLGISMKLDPNCIESDSSTWNISTYYNRSLASNYGNAYAPYANLGAVVTPNYPLTASNPTLATGTAQFAPNGLVVPLDLYYYGSAAASPTISITLSANTSNPLGSILPQGNPQEDWIRSAMVDVAGDGQGNYALVRSNVMPYFQENDISSMGIGRARGLVGHQYSPALGGWIQRPSKPSANTLNEPAASFVEPNVMCQGPSGSATEFIPCSVRNPRFLMSNTGQGLILFTQNQFLTPNADAVTTTPNRLWWASYSSATGFGSAAQMLDPDTTCNSTSTGNDASVCEAASFYDTLIPSGLTNLHCQTIGEPSTQTFEPMFPSLTHDITPFAAAMNAAGQAVVAFAKPSQLPTTPPSCGPVGIFAMTYDPTNGWGNATQVDNGITVEDPITGIDVGTGDSMHPNVFITPGGLAGVTWETLAVPQGASGASGASAASGIGPSGSSVGVYYSTLSWGSTWSAPTMVNTSAAGPSGSVVIDHTNPNDSMMPSIGLNDTNEVVVTYTYSPYGPTGELSPRRQFANHYYLPPGGN